MMFWFILLGLIFINGYTSEKNDFRQEAAKVIYSNPKYVKDVSIFTFRRKRNSPYLTNTNFTILHPWSNNITLVVMYEKGKSDTYPLEAKLCDYFKMSWAKQWLAEFSNVPPHCPLPAKTYNWYGVELPPRNFPMIAGGGDYSMATVFTVSATKEKILELRINLRFTGK